jgi:hypothetical protein
MPVSINQIDDERGRFNPEPSLMVEPSLSTTALPDLICFLRQPSPNLSHFFQNFSMLICRGFFGQTITFFRKPNRH